MVDLLVFNSENLGALKMSQLFLKTDFLVPQVLMRKFRNRKLKHHALPRALPCALPGALPYCY